MTTKLEREQEEARDTLREFVTVGTTVYTVLRHVSRSGMTRDIDLYVIQDDNPRWITRLACKATGRRFNERAEAMRVEGCGMDMGFDAVYSLARALYPEGFGCIGAGCPSNDHSNGDRDYTVHQSSQSPHDGRGVGHWHTSGGYALNHRWM